MRKWLGLNGLRRVWGGELNWATREAMAFLQGRRGELNMDEQDVQDQPFASGASCLSCASMFELLAFNLGTSGRAANARTIPRAEQRPIFTFRGSAGGHGILKSMDVTFGRATIACKLPTTITHLKSTKRISIH